MKKYLMILLAAGLSACGFHLKGTTVLDAPMPYHTWAVEGGVLQNALTDVLRRQPDVEVGVSNPQVVVKVLQLTQNKTTSSINQSGSTSEYLLVLQAQVQAYRNGEPLGEPMAVRVERYMDYSDSAILGKQDEEQTIWREMRREAAEQIVRRLNYLPAQ